MLLTLEQAWEKIVAHVGPSTPVRVPLAESGGAILAEDVFATIDSPPFDKSMMDGYALRTGDLQAGLSSFRVIEEVAAGQVPRQAVTTGTAIRIMTGAAIPDGADAVIQLEWTTSTGSEVRIDKGTSRGGLNILPRGQSMRSGEKLFGAGESIRAQTMAVLAETGHARPLVRRRPVVGILATGDELVDVDQTPGPGQIRNSNALMLAAQVSEAGAEPRLLGIARDQRDDLRAKILTGLDCDFLCLSGGVSAGNLDLVPSELAAAGVEAVFHKVAMKPGKPCWFGVRPPRAGKGAGYVFGLPGNPVSSMVCFELFVRLALRRWTGIDISKPQLSAARLVGAFSHRGDRQTLFPARVFAEQGVLHVQPVDWKGSADLRSTAQANCSISIPIGEVAWNDGTLVDILPWGRTLGI
ncbi:molybdopterin molybdotransferase MoeA [Planctomicrobium piriforme]|uniref:Molybdopterin molybdenumtransferase n=1 Tax=Planctomicrobium piriforme TaxID=1576369 RepID=A0A1I3AQR1_9PLAN|nr:gephyrin-like molybdotransferase Glp [Planctomicrobium piriforme]SFH52395.1 molybdopterin molybdotransferase [Planctomicrobium piriforme]